MLIANETKLHALLENDALTHQVLEIIRADEQERHDDLIRRQREGQIRARERGTRVGRPLAKKPKSFPHVYALYQDNQISARAASTMLGVSPGTFRRWIREDQAVRGTYAPLANDALAQQVVQHQAKRTRQVKKSGVHTGRPRSKKPSAFPSVYTLYQDNQISAHAASHMLGVAPSTFKRWVSEEQDKSANTK